MKSPKPNVKPRTVTPLKVVPAGKAAAPAPVRLGVSWPKTDGGTRMIASKRALSVIEILCRFIGLLLFLIVLIVFTVPGSLLNIALGESTAVIGTVWIGDVDAERVTSFSGLSIVLHGYSKIVGTRP